MRMVITEVGKQGQPTPFTLCQAKVGVIHPRHLGKNDL
jgi:hypothetical protein